MDTWSKGISGKRHKESIQSTKNEHQVSPQVMKMHREQTYTRLYRDIHYTTIHGNKSRGTSNEMAPQNTAQPEPDGTNPRVARTSSANKRRRLGYDGR